MKYINEDFLPHLTYAYNALSPRVKVTLANAKKSLPNVKQKLADNLKKISNAAMNAHTSLNDPTSKLHKMAKITNAINKVSDFSATPDPDVNYHRIASGGTYTLANIANKLHSKLTT